MAEPHDVVSNIPTPPGVNPPGTSSLGQTSWGQTTLVLPESGDLLSLENGIGGSLLVPHAQHWCNLPGTLIPKNVGTAITGHHRLYFLTYSISGTVSLASVPFAGLHCAG
ncbi:hypothetical protein [Ferrimicrobium sp.]|uniref:hypothetical protein n=1 Tax=Ferrimicrobium sp. TaxID=2926050 RepID=UPI00260F1A12|nr:hypothetical protein [Ferrimicrobium sp.]